MAAGADLQTRVAQLDTLVEQHCRDMERMRAQLGALEHAVTEAARTPWPTLASWSGVLLAIVLAISGLVAWTFDTRIESLNVAGLHDQIVGHLDGHPERVVDMIQEIKAMQLQMWAEHNQVHRDSAEHIRSVVHDEIEDLREEMRREVDAIRSDRVKP